MATFTALDPNAVAGDFSATIFWGDGTDSDGTIGGDATDGFTVTGEHSYGEENSYVLATQISDTEDDTAVAASYAKIIDSVDDHVLETINNYSLPYTSTLTQTGASINGTYNLNASGTLNFTLTENGSTVPGSFQLDAHLPGQLLAERERHR